LSRQGRAVLTTDGTSEDSPATAGRDGKTHGNCSVSVIERFFFRKAVMVIVKKTVFVRFSSICFCLVDLVILAAAALCSADASLYVSLVFSLRHRNGVLFLNINKAQYNLIQKKESTTFGSSNLGF
jgi:hypothetical protein